MTMLTNPLIPTDYPTLPAKAFVGLGRTSDYLRFHRATDPTTVGVLCSIPDYVETRRQLALLIAHEAPREPARLDAVAVAVDRIREALERGEQPPPASELLPGVGIIPTMEGANRQHLGLPVVANATEVLGIRVQREALDRVHVELVLHLDSLVRGGSTRFFRSISEQLVIAVDEARRLAAAGAYLESADDAIAADLVDEWKAAQALKEQYVALRQAQTFWAGKTGFTALLGGSAGTPPFAAFVANPLDVEPDLPRIITGVPYRDSDDEAAYLKQARHAEDLWPDWADESALRWFIDNPDATPWAPTSAQFDEALVTLSRAYVRHERMATAARRRAKAGRVR